MLIVSLEYFCPIKTDMIHYIDPIYNKDCTTLTNKIQPSNHHHAIITKRPNFYTSSTPCPPLLNITCDRLIPAPSMPHQLLFQRDQPIPQHLHLALQLAFRKG